MPVEAVRSWRPTTFDRARRTDGQRGVVDHDPTAGRGPMRTSRRRHPGIRRPPRPRITVGLVMVHRRDGRAPRRARPGQLTSVTHADISSATGATVARPITGGPDLVPGRRNSAAAGEPTAEHRMIHFRARSRRRESSMLVNSTTPGPSAASTPPAGSRHLSWMRRGTSGAAVVRVAPRELLTDPPPPTSTDASSGPERTGAPAVARATAPWMTSMSRPIRGARAPSDVRSAAHQKTSHPRRRRRTRR